MDEDRFFAVLAEKTESPPEEGERAPARLKARVYSALVVRQAATGPLRSLRATRADGRDLCVFERLLELVPDEQITTRNPCRACHARLLAEHFESPPVYWPHCPYVSFRRQ